MRKKSCVQIVVAFRKKIWKDLKKVQLKISYFFSVELVLSKFSEIFV